MLSEEGSTGEDVEPSPAVERLTVALVGDAVHAMARARRRSGLKKVDILNRALVVYDFLDSEMRRGKQVILRDSDGNEERVRMI